MGIYRCEVSNSSTVRLHHATSPDHTLEFNGAVPDWVAEQVHVGHDYTASISFQDYTNYTTGEAPEATTAEEAEAGSTS